MSEGKNYIKWYESGNTITTLIIITILAAIFCSQSFAVSGDNSFSIFSSVINHNSVYLVVLVYFVLLKTKFGKKYFNYLNVFLIFFYLISTCTSLLTLFQSFSLNTVLDFSKNLVLLLYLFHTMFRDTRVWHDLKLGASPFNEIYNEGYYYALLVLVVLGLAVNFISALLSGGLFIPVLDALYLLLFGRYIYLYREYLDYHALDAENEGNFDDIKNKINENISDVLEKTEIDDKIVAAAGKVKEATQDILSKTESAAGKVKETTKDILDKTEIDDKIVEAAGKAKETTKDILVKAETAAGKVKETTKDILDKTEIDDKIVEAVGKVKEKTQDILDKTEIDDKIVDLTQKTKDKLSESSTDKKSKREKKKDVK